MTMYRFAIGGPMDVEEVRNRIRGMTDEQALSCTKRSRNGVVAKLVSATGGRDSVGAAIPPALSAGACLPDGRDAYGQ